MALLTCQFCQAGTVQHDWGTQHKWQLGAAAQHGGPSHTAGAAPRSTRRAMEDLAQRSTAAGLLTAQLSLHE